MKKLLICISTLLPFLVMAQEDFTKELAVARTAYAAKKLDDSRFAMQQMLQDLDMITGKELLKILPTTLQDQAANTVKDNVTGTSGFMGVVVHREYGTADKNISLEIISNSPLITSINALLSLPIIGNTGDNKVIKINGYKALVQKVAGENDRTNYDLQLPLSNTLFTLRAPGYTQEQVIAMANTLPVSQIAKLLQ